MSHITFESSVNLQGSKTAPGAEARNPRPGYKFESSVNLQGSKTVLLELRRARQFESSVNLQGSKTAEK